MKKSRPQLRVFISHAKKASIATIEDYVRAEGAIVVNTLSSVGLRPSRAIESAIRRSDAMVAVLKEASPEVWIEIGLAVGAQKPLLVLVPSSSMLPLTLTARQHVAWPAEHTELLRLGIRSFLNDLRRSGEAAKHLPPDRPAVNARLGAWADTSATSSARADAMQEIAGELTALRSSGGQAQLRPVVARLLVAAGVRVIEEPASDGLKAADFALWLDPLDSIGGNPVLVEVKSGSLGASVLHEAHDRLARAITHSRAGTGLLLYLDSAGLRFDSPQQGLFSVVSFDLEDLARKLVDESLAAVVAARRSAQQQGGS